METIVEMKDVRKGFGHGSARVMAVDGLSLSMTGGEIFCLVGPDGAGKTTTIRMLCTVMRPDQGLITVLGCNSVKETMRIRKKIGYLSQRFSLYGDLTISENVDFFAEIHGLRNYAVRKRELLEFMRLDRFQDRLAERLSGGMKQKLALACTLIHTPEIIFLDEPTTGVDPVSRRDFWWILSRLQREGLSIFISTPYMDEAERAHRVAMMYGGRIIECGTPAEIKATLSGRIMEIMCSKVREARRILEHVSGIIDVQAFGDRIHIKASNELEIDRVVGVLSGQGIDIHDARLINPNLEDAFIHLLQHQEIAREAV